MGLERRRVTGAMHRPAGEDVACGAPTASPLAVPEVGQRQLDRASRSRVSDPGVHSPLSRVSKAVLGLGTVASFFPQTILECSGSLPRRSSPCQALSAHPMIL